MSTILTDINNDLYLDTKGNFALSKNKLEEIKQNCQNTLQTFLGEVSDNLSLGVDYIGIVLNEEIPLESKINELTSAILTIDGVVGINENSYSIDKGIATFDFEIQTNVGNFNFSDLLV